MRPHELENWVLNIVERVQNHEPVEDSRVELKTEWPQDINGAARRIAGHANAAQGEPILWIVGVDEKRGVVVGAQPEELSKWYAKLVAQFNELAPSLLMSRDIPTDGTTVVALLFETDRAPYVRKVPDSRLLEVPWREGTAVKSATRTDLLRLLSPLQRLPEFEVLSGKTLVKKTGAFNKAHWEIRLELYTNTQGKESIFIPFHKCRAQIEIPGCLDLTKIESIYLHSSTPGTIYATGSQIEISGPGLVDFVASLSFNEMPSMPTSDAIVDIWLLPAGANREIKLHLPMVLNHTDEGTAYQWEWVG